MGSAEFGGHNEGDLGLMFHKAVGSWTAGDLGLLESGIVGLSWVYGFPGKWHSTRICPVALLHGLSYWRQQSPPCGGRSLAV